jgi:hypothetical protein
MSFDPTYFFFDFVVGSIGFTMLVYGMKQKRIPQIFAGILLMADPYFASTVPVMLIAAAVISAGLWWALREGY